MKVCGFLKVRKNAKKGLRIWVCIIIVLGAVILKRANPHFLQYFSGRVQECLRVEEAVAVLSGESDGNEEVIEVFEEKDELSYHIEQSEVVEKAEMEEEKENIEMLSFQMSEEELLDDTKAEEFKIPPPSSCSYNKADIKFKFSAPLDGMITSEFGYRDHPLMDDSNFHTGLDVAAKKGTKIKAFADGKVIKAGFSSIYGNYLLIDHGDGISSFYGHSSKLLVKKGDSVKLGGAIAEVGSTGMSTGPHLHFEIRSNNIRLNPRLYVYR